MTLRFQQVTLTYSTSIRCSTKSGIKKKNPLRFSWTRREDEGIALWSEQNHTEGNAFPFQGQLYTFPPLQKKKKIDRYFILPI